MDGETVITIAGALLGTGGIGGALAYVWKERETFYKSQHERMAAEVAAARTKIDELQNKLLSQANAQAAALVIQAETYQKLARSLEEQNATLKEALRVRG